MLWFLMTCEKKTNNINLSSNRAPGHDIEVPDVLMLRNTVETYLSDYHLHRHLSNTLCMGVL